MRLAVLTLALAVPAAAYADACAAVKAAYDKLAVAPAYRQKIALPDLPPMQVVMIGDTMYMDQGDGAWQTMPLEPGMRQQMMQQTVPDATALEDCADLGADTIEGVAMIVYEYTPPPVGGMDAGRQKLWVGAADGLPHRMTSEQDGQPITMELGFDGVTAPLP